MKNIFCFCAESHWPSLQPAPDFRETFVIAHADGRDVGDGAEFILDEGVADGEGNVEAVDGELRCAVEGHRSQVFIGVLEFGEFKSAEKKLKSERITHA